MVKRETIEKNKNVITLAILIAAWAFMALAIFLADHGPRPLPPPRLPPPPTPIGGM